MTTNVTNTKSTSELTAEYLQKAQTAQEQAAPLIAKLRELYAQEPALLQKIQQEKVFGLPGTVATYQKQLDDLNAQIKDLINQINTVAPGTLYLTNALLALQNGIYSVAGNEVATMGQDVKMLNEYLNKLLDALNVQLKIEDERNDMKSAGPMDNDQLMQFAIEMSKLSSQEYGILSSLQTEICNDLVALNNQKNAADIRLNNIRWYDYIDPTQDAEGEKEECRSIIRNYEAMRPLLMEIMSDTAPQMAGNQNQIYTSATLALDKVMRKLLEVLQDPNMNGAQKAEQIKYLMAIALGILSMIQSDAAEQKGENQQKQVSASMSATEMNISNQQAQLKKLEDDLKYARDMGTLMDVVKPIMQVAGCLLAPGLGSLALMVMLTIADEMHLTDKLKDEVAKIPGLGDLGAEICVGALTMLAVVAGGAALDRMLAKAGQQALASAAKGASETAKRVTEEAVQNALAKANKVGNEAAEKATREVVEKAVNDAIEQAVAKTVKQFNNQTAATLVPQLFRAGKEAGTVSVTAALAKAAEKNAIQAAEKAATIASQDVAFLAQAAASGAKVSAAESAAISSRASNEAVASISGSTTKAIAASNDSKTLSRAGWAGVYYSLSEGAVSQATEAALKKAGIKKDSDEFMAIMTTIKALEGILASLALMQGTGMLQMAMMQGSGTTLMKVASGSQFAGTAVQGVAQGGQAEATMKQAEAVQAINESSVSNDMLNLFLKDYAQQRDIDRKRLESDMADQSSTYMMIMGLENNGKEAARVLTEQSV